MDTPRYTPQIQRYNLKIIQYWKWLEDRVPPSHIEYEEPLAIETLVKGEPHDLDIAENLEVYLKYLESRKAIWHKGYGMETGFQIADDGEHYMYPDTFSINLRDVRPIHDLERLLTDGRTIVPKDVSAHDRHFQLLKDGVLQYGPSALKVAFKETGSLYFHLLEAVVALSPGHDEYVPYEAIEKYLTNNLGESPEPKRTRAAQRIREALSKSLKPQWKVLGIPLKLEDGREVFQIMRGKGIKFNNPSIKFY